MIQGIFKYRKSRRLAEIEIDSEVFEAYVSNGADMAFLKPGTICYLREVDNPNRSTGFDLFSVYDQNTLVCVDAKEPLIVARYWLDKRLREELASNDIYFIENTRSMYLSCGRRGQRDDITIQIMGTSLSNSRTAYLPERQSSTLNQRLEDVLRLNSLGHDARLLFVVCRDDVDSFCANADADPYFAELFEQILDTGASVECLRCTVNGDGMFADRLIPIEGM